LDGNQTNLTLVRENVIVQVVGLRGRNAEYGFSVSNLTWADQSLDTVENSIGSSEQIAVSSWESAILFSDEAMGTGSRTTGLLYLAFILKKKKLNNATFTTVNMTPVLDNHRSIE
jgi:hypothetical protein